MYLQDIEKHVRPDGALSPNTSYDAPSGPASPLLHVLLLSPLLPTVRAHYKLCLSLITLHVAYIPPYVPLHAA